MCGFGEEKGGAVQVGGAVAQAGQRALHRVAQIIRRVGQRPQPEGIAVVRHHDAHQIAVIGAGFQRLGPAGGEGQNWLAKSAQGRQTGGVEGLHRHHQRGLTAAGQHHRHPHAQIGAGAGEKLDRGGGEGHGAK